MGDLGPKFWPDLDQKWFKKKVIFKVFTPVLQFYRHITEINMVLVSLALFFGKNFMYV